MWRYPGKLWTDDASRDGRETHPSQCAQVFRTSSIHKEFADLFAKRDGTMVPIKKLNPAALIHEISLISMLASRCIRGRPRCGPKRTVQCTKLWSVWTLTPQCGQVMVLCPSKACSGDPRRHTRICAITIGADKSEAQGSVQSPHPCRRFAERLAPPPFLCQHTRHVFHCAVCLLRTLSTARLNMTPTRGGASLSSVGCDADTGFVGKIWLPVAVFAVLREPAAPPIGRQSSNNPSAMVRSLTQVSGHHHFVAAAACRDQLIACGFSPTSSPCGPRSSPHRNLSPSAGLATCHVRVR